MSQEQPNPPSLPPTEAIQTDPDLRATTENWFEYPIIAYPHQTDYAGIVWHGCYLTWLEEARIECLRSLGIEYADLVNLGCELPVIELALRYHRSLRMGMRAVVKTRMSDLQGVRINWEYKIVSPDGKETYVTASVTLVGIDREKGKIYRELPPAVKNALVKLRI
ncbi:MAG: acyl-CoA thioesterase [Gomphosphaeria aponina SAG 52.96 = DSM 107014]|uniref:Acyl-CoA thioesterase n=1 Tax=Gomphosphaeria aponina SAG 52.96 = DSM 107014 TaxID=1521640 RepID=A0A941JP50_9CHRO|nr:acyl-CoA thioesterase [Gomphosphaeria aponina SAG 52.96 = DSM 107014]